MTCLKDTTLKQAVAENGEVQRQEESVISYEQPHKLLSAKLVEWMLVGPQGIHQFAFIRSVWPASQSKALAVGLR